MNSHLLWAIIGMAAVTYIPRMLPLVFLNTTKIPKSVQAILKNVPYAALGALIFPGILTVNDDPMLGIIGGVTAFFFAYFGANLIVVVLSSIAVLTIVSLIS